MHYLCTYVSKFSVERAMFVGQVDTLAVDIVNGYIYWNHNVVKINKRARLDGSEKQDFAAGSKLNSFEKGDCVFCNRESARVVPFNRKYAKLSVSNMEKANTPSNECSCY